VQRVRRLGSLLARVKRDVQSAAWPAALSAVVGPMTVALVPGLKGVAAEFLPPGPERLLLLAVGFALGAEVVRCHVLIFSLTRRLRAATAARPAEEAP